MTFREKAVWGIDGVNRLAAFACHFLLTIITLVTVLQVFLRFFLSRPTSWSEEIALLCLIWFGPVSYTHLDVYKRQLLHQFLGRWEGAVY